MTACASTSSDSLCVPANDGRAAVIRAQIGEIGQRLDEGKVVEPVDRVEVAAVEAAMKPVFAAARGIVRPADVGVRLFEAHPAADNFLRQTDNSKVCEIVEEAGRQVRQVVDAEQFLRGRRQMAIGPGSSPVSRYARFKPIYRLPQFLHLRRWQHPLDDDVAVDVEEKPLTWSQRGKRQRHQCSAAMRD